MLRHDRALTAFKRVVSTAAVAAVVCTPEATADRGACERSA
jgi:hypothetical protein